MRAIHDNYLKSTGVPSLLFLGLIDNKVSGRLKDVDQKLNRI